MTSQTDSETEELIIESKYDIKRKINEMKNKYEIDKRMDMLRKKYENDEFEHFEENVKNVVKLSEFEKSYSNFVHNTNIEKIKIGYNALLCIFYKLRNMKYIRRFALLSKRTSGIVKYAKINPIKISDMSYSDIDFICGNIQTLHYTSEEISEETNYKISLIKKDNTVLKYQCTYEDYIKYYDTTLEYFKPKYINKFILTITDNYDFNVHNVCKSKCFIDGYNLLKNWIIFIETFNINDLIPENNIKYLFIIIKSADDEIITKLMNFHIDDVKTYIYTKYENIVEDLNLKRIKHTKRWYKFRRNTF